MILFQITGWENHWHTTIHRCLIALAVYSGQLLFTTFLTFYFVTFLQSDSQERCDLSNGNTQQLSALGHHPGYGRRRSHRRGLPEEGPHTWKKASPELCQRLKDAQRQFFFTCDSIRVFPQNESTFSEMLTRVQFQIWWYSHLMLWSVKPFHTAVLGISSVIFENYDQFTFIRL